MARQPEDPAAETEEQIISRAQSAVSQCNWVVGDCAAAWTKKYAKGRTDADFAALVGMSADQVYQRRRVAETFGDIRENYPALRWSHFYVAVNWDDAPECLQWAAENEATVAEMKAWRRALRGEDLTADADENENEWIEASAVALVPTESSIVRDPDAFGGEGGRERSGSRAEGAQPELVGAVAREADGGGDYSPYRQGAAHPAPQDAGGTTTVAERPQPSAEQLLKRLTTTLERMNKAMTPELLREMKQQPQKKRDRLVQALAEVSSKTAELM